MLGDLSSLVKIAKRLQETLQLERSTHAVYEHMVYELLEELLLKAFKVVIRAVRFLDIWSQDVAPGTAIEYSDPNNRPPTPPVDTSESRPSTRLNSPVRQDADAASPMRPILKEDHPQSRSKTPAPRALTPQSPLRSGQSTASVQGSSQNSQFGSRSTPVQPKRLSVSHRLSYVGKAGGLNVQNLASERLNAANDSFLSFLATLLGLALQFRSAEEFISTTQQSVTACRQLLAVAEEVWVRDGRRSEPLQQARDVMYAKLAELVQATRDMFASTMTGEEILDPDQGKLLVISTTNCIRAAGDCVSRTRSVIERIGDFEVEQVGLGLAGSVFESQRPEQSPPRQTPEFHKPLPIPPDLASRPPPTLQVQEAKLLPEPPKLPPIVPDDSGLRSMIMESSDAFSSRLSKSSVPPLAPLFVPQLPSSGSSSVSPTQSNDASPSDVFGHSARTGSVNASVAETNSTWRTSIHQDNASSFSASTRATTPDRSPVNDHPQAPMVESFGSISELQSFASEEAVLEEQVLEKTFAHELIYNKEGQITGGSLPALIEKLTTHDATPDATFVTTFYLTFRLFTTSCEFAQSLIDRFEYIGESQSICMPVRLRVYNIFKGWLESHWQSEADSPALNIINDFATGRLGAILPAAGKRLAELAFKVSEVQSGTLVPRLVSSLGKTSTSVTVFSAADSQIPHSNVTKSQLNALRSARNGGSPCSILDFDPLELARQFTIIESRIFCSIGPEELLALEWTKKTDSRAINVKAMSTLSTDLANLVADTVLQFDDVKKRVAVIKQWIKIGIKCLELNNYDSLMAIICSLNSSMVLRLKKTWELVPAKNKARLEELKAVVDVGKNYAVLRQRLQNHVAPCIPFVGIYLTDLTFVDVGNHTTRQLPGDPSRNGTTKSVINFDKHMKTAKIIGQLQRFQVPYRLAAVPEMQDWMESQIQRVRCSDQANVQSYYRRSLILEPRETPHQQHAKGSPPESGHLTKELFGGVSTKEKLERWGQLPFLSGGNKEKVVS